MAIVRRTHALEAVLSVLLEGPNHGLEIAKRTNLQHPTVYRCLARLLEEGWITAEEKGTTQVYTVTEAGREGAASWFTPEGKTVGRYRRRPEYVRAIRWTGDNWPAVEAFCGSGIDRREGDTIWMATVHGPERCDLGDWIIEGVEDFYPNRHNVFLAIYQGPESST